MIQAMASQADGIVKFASLAPPEATRRAEASQRFFDILSKCS